MKRPTLQLAEIAGELVPANDPSHDEAAQAPAADLVQWIDAIALAMAAGIRVGQRGMLAAPTGATDRADAALTPGHDPEVMDADEVAAFLGGRSQHRLRLRRARRDPTPAAGQAAPVLAERARVMVGGMQGRVGSEGVTMPIRRGRDGRWRYREMVRKPDGTRERISGCAPRHINTKVAAQQEMLQHIERILHPERVPTQKEVPTFHEWFTGRFWREWVVGRRNKPTEVKSKQIIYECHLKAAFGDLPLDEIGPGEIAAFRASLVEKGLSEKRINNILAVLSKPLKYAVDCELIGKAPKIGLYKVERPEIEPWDFEQYARLLAAAKIEGPDWYVAVCLAGEAGLRSGEVKALRWREDVDLIARTITVNQQTCYGETTTPKGRTRRTIPMTSTLELALRRLEVVREGYVVRNVDGSAKTDGQANAVILRICRRAGLPEKRWHTLRHSFGTHAALFGVNPWRLQSWMGHKRIDETMIYVHVAENHRRDLPPAVIEAGLGEADPDRRVLKMLGARADLRGKNLAKTEAGRDENPAILVG